MSLLLWLVRQITARRQGETGGVGGSFSPSSWSGDDGLAARFCGRSQTSVAGLVAWTMLAVVAIIARFHFAQNVGAGVDGFGGPAGHPSGGGAAFVCSTALIALVGIVGRAVGGRETGMIATVIAALSPVHWVTAMFPYTVSLPAVAGLAVFALSAPAWSAHLGGVLTRTKDLDATHPALSLESSPGSDPTGPTGAVQIGPLVLVLVAAVALVLTGPRLAFDSLLSTRNALDIEVDPDPLYTGWVGLSNAAYRVADVWWWAMLVGSLTGFVIFRRLPAVRLMALASGVGLVAVAFGHARWATIWTASFMALGVAVLLQGLRSTDDAPRPGDTEIDR